MRLIRLVLLLLTIILILSSFTFAAIPEQDNVTINLYPREISHNTVYFGVMGMGNESDNYLDFSNDYMILPNDNPNFNFDNGLTISYWVNFDSNGKQETFYFRDTTTNNPLIKMTKNNGGGTSNDEISIRGTLGSTTVTGSYFSNSNDVWEYVVLTYNDTDDTMRFYIDGSIVATSSAVNVGLLDFFNPVDGLRIGSTTTNLNYMDGKMDTVEIYNNTKDLAWIVAKNSSGRTGTINITGSDISYYNDMSALSDLSSNYNNGISTGGTMVTNTNEYFMDGTNDYVQLDNTSIGNPGNKSISYSIWFKTIEHLDRGLVSKGQAGNFPLITLSINTGYLYTAMEGTGDQTPDLMTTGMYNDSVWHHAVLVIDADLEERHIYMDGGAEIVNDTYNAASVGPINPTQNLYLGRYESTYLSGNMSNFLIYDNTVLTESDAAILYNLGRIDYYVDPTSFITITNQTITPEIISQNDNLLCDANVTGTNIYNFTYYVGTSTYVNTSNLSNQFFNLSDEVICEVNAINGTDTASNNVSKTIGQTITFTGNNTLSGSVINNFTISYSGGNITANGSSLVIYNYNITEEYVFSHPEYQDSYVNLTTNVTSQSYNFELFTTNSIFFNIKNAETHILINSTVNIDIVSVNIGGINYNYTTDNGTLYVDLIFPNDYIIYFTSDNYSSTQIFFVMTNKSTTNLDVFMYDNTVSTQITYSVVSEIGDKLSEAKVAALQFFGSSWNEVGQCLTNDAGICSIDLDADSFYHYYVFYQDDITPKFSTTIPERATYTNNARSPFVLDLSENELVDYQEYDNVTIIDFSVSNTTNNYTFRLQATYSDSVDNVCMSLYETMPSYELLDTSCLNTSGNIVYINRLLENKTYEAYAYSIIDDKNFNIQKITVNLFSKIGIFDKFGVIITFFMVLTVICLALALKQYNLITYGLPGVLLLANMMGFISITYSSILILIVIILSIINRKREVGT